MICTIYQNIFSREKHYVEVDDALGRIKNGKSRALVEEIRNTLDKEKAQVLKQNLPAVCFSGKFGNERTDNSLIEHSGFIVLDFDNVENIREKQTEIINKSFTYACWVSPSGSGLKALVRIKNKDRHRQHFLALKEIFPEIDKSGINQSRVCYESYDPEIYEYPDCEIFSDEKEENVSLVSSAQRDELNIFKNLLTWLANKREAFVTGERNNFIFKLAAACCRYGIAETSAQGLIQEEFVVTSDFTMAEAMRTIKSAYKANALKFGDCVFEKNILVERTTRAEVKPDSTIFDPGIKPKDVIYGLDVKDKAMELYRSGYPKIHGIGVPGFDELYKPKKGEVTILTGIGNYGKSTLKKWYQVFRALLYDEKFGCFGPEDSPAEEYYHDLTEILLGADCTPMNHFRPSEKEYESAYDFICKHFFYIYPESHEPTPEYVQERFLELIIKEKIDGCDIDPFNQMANKYYKHTGRDKYLEYTLAMFNRFAQINQVYFWIIAHPKLVEKDKSGNYVCPDVFDIADGAMWNNKADNILVYHRPLAQTSAQDPMCEFYSKKIRRQKIVGKKGFIIFAMNFPKRRFEFNGEDPMGEALKRKKLSFGVARQNEIRFKNVSGEQRGFLPYKDDTGNEIGF